MNLKLMSHDPTRRDSVVHQSSIKNSNYDAAYDYLTSKPLLDENGKRIPRESFIRSIKCTKPGFLFSRIKICISSSWIHQIERIFVKNTVLKSCSMKLLEESYRSLQCKFPYLKDIKAERTALYQQKHAQYECHS